MAELKVLIKECGYEENMQNILLKDQFIFGVTIREIQEHLLNEIGDNHDLNQCLIEACKIESHIAQRKLSGLKSVQYDSIGNQRSRPQKKKFKPKDKRPQSRSQSGIRDCKYCGTNHQHQQCPAYGKTCKVVARKIILQRSVIQEAKAYLATLAVRSHSSTEKSMWTKSLAMIAK